MSEKMPKTRLREVLDVPEIREYVKNYYTERRLKKGKASSTNYTHVAMSRWRNGPHYPPVEVLIGMAKILGTNVSFILGRTNVNRALDLIPEKEKTLDELLSLKGMTELEFIRHFNDDWGMLARYRKRLPLTIKSLIKISDILDLSIDFILGYSSWENWDLYAKTAKPFDDIPPGSAAFLVTDTDVRSSEDVIEAFKKGNGKFCLVSTDGKEVIFPDGLVVSVDNETFQGFFIAKVTVEV